MDCPYCNDSTTKVVDKRDLEEGNVSRRRRECLKCKKRFTTYERIEKLSVNVVKKDGDQEDYDREKLLKGIGICAKNRMPSDEVDRIIDDIESTILSRNVIEISSSDLGRMVLRRLKLVDKIAYMRFASVFLEFDGLDEFKIEMKRIE